MPDICYMLTAADTRLAAHITGCHDGEMVASDPRCLPLSEIITHDEAAAVTGGGYRLVRLAASGPARDDDGIMQCREGFTVLGAEPGMSAATGLTHSEIYRRGLDASERESMQATVERTIRAELGGTTVREAMENIAAALPVLVQAMKDRGDVWSLKEAEDKRGQLYPSRVRPRVPRRRPGEPLRPARRGAPRERSGMIGHAAPGLLACRASPDRC